MLTRGLVIRRGVRGTARRQFQCGSRRFVRKTQKRDRLHKLNRSWASLWLSASLHARSRYSTRVGSLQDFPDPPCSARPAGTDTSPPPACGCVPKPWLCCICAIPPHKLHKQNEGRMSPDTRPS